MKLPSKFAALVYCMVSMASTGAGTALWGQAGGFAYVTNCGAFCGGLGGPSNVSGYSIDGTTGALVPVTGSPFAAGQGPFSVTVHPTGQFAYVANQATNNVSAYAIDGTTGTLTPVDGSPFPAGSIPVSVTTTAGPPLPPATAARK